MIFFSSLNSSRSSPLPCLLTSFSLSESIKQQNHEALNKQKSVKQKNTTPKARTYKIVYFMLAKYSWVWALPWSLVEIYPVTHLEKTKFSLCQWVSLQIASWLGGGTLCPLPIFYTGILSGVNLCWSCACITVSVSWYVY